MKATTPVHPFLLALVPVLSLYAVNRLEVPARDLLRPSAAALLLAAAAWGAAALFVRTGPARALLGCVALAAVFLYGRALGTAVAFVPQAVFLPLWCAVAAAAWIAVARGLRRDPPFLPRLTAALNVFAVVLVTGVLAPVLATWPAPAPRPGRTPEVDGWIREALAHGASNTPPGGLARRPDVYFIVLDGYARGDILASRFGRDNDDFLSWLRREGFVVGDRTHSNYAWTHLSLAATLNAEYLPDLVGGRLDAGAPRAYRQRFQYYTRALAPFIADSRVERFFAGLGYRVVALRSGAAATRRKGRSPAELALGPVGEFEQVLLDTTVFAPLSLWVGRRLPARAKARGAKHAQVLRQLDRLVEAAREEGPKFVFAHILSPHDPFCFDGAGGRIGRHPLYDRSAWLEDKRALPGFAAWYRESYPANLAGLGVRLRETLAKILESDGGDAVIVLQADHGSALGIDPHSAEGTDVAERFGILRAVRVPPWADGDAVSAGASAVNTFRGVLAGVFGVGLAPLEDRAFFSDGDLRLTEVTSRLAEERAPGAGGTARGQ